MTPQASLGQSVKRTRSVHVLPAAPLDSGLVGQRRATLGAGFGCSTLSDRFSVLAISVLYRSCGIPIAWKVVRAQTKRAWEPHWKALLAQLEASFPAGWVVLVLADRGLYARWLYEAILHLGWRPFLRVNAGGTYRPAAGGGLCTQGSAVQAVGQRWCGKVVCGHRAKATAGLHLSCLLGARPSGALAGTYGSAAGAGPGRLVWLKGVDRSGIQGHHARRVAMASDEDG